MKGESQVVETNTKRTLKGTVGERARRAGVPSFRARADKKDNRAGEREKNEVASHFAFSFNNTGDMK